MVRILIRIVSLLVLLAFVLVGLVAMMPADRVAKLATDQISLATGRVVTISGDVSMSFWPVLGASVEGLEVGNASWSQQGPMLSAQNASIGVDARGLLSGDIRITRIEAVAPTIRLESRADGRASWQFTDASGEAQITTSTSPNRVPQSFSIDRVEISNATLIYDAEGADTLQYGGVDLTLDWPDPDGSATLAALAEPAGLPVRLDARIDRFAAFLAGETHPVFASLESDAGSASITGQANLAGAVAGALDLNAASLDRFLRALSLPGVDLPEGLGKSLSLSSEVNLTPERQLSLRGLSVDLGAGNRLTGTADISLNGVPQVVARVDAGALDLRALTGGPESGGETSAGSAGWDKTPIDASGLAAFNGEIAINATSVDLGTLKLGKMNTVLRNDRSRMVFGLREVAAYGGNLSGEFVMNNRSGLSVGGKLSGRGLQLQGLLTDLAEIDTFTGAMDSNLQFLGVGNSLHAIMNSLSGSGDLNMGRGTIEGINLDRLMRAGDAGRGTTVFDSLTASVTMDQGQMINDDLLLLLQNFEAHGAGRIGLGPQDIDYLFTPVALRVNDGQGLAIPVRIRGPWSGPRILPDLERALDLNLEKEKERLEQRAKDEVEKAKDEVDQKVAKELGVTQNEGQSVKDAAKQKVEQQQQKIEDKLKDEVGDRLKSLFD